ncbi:MAG: pyridoxamine 5'-phosphate oxidase family protein [Planctomycetota bacterium]|jgi:uncharacterized protein YhbP (UPF0306 family)
MTQLNDRQVTHAIRKTLARSKTMGLATVDDKGAPHAANVNFVADDQLNLYWLSKPDSAHSRHLAARPDIAGTAYPSYRLPNRIRGVQIHGRAEELPNDLFDTVWKIYAQKFPYAHAIKNRVRNEDRFYRLAPTWLRLIDNTIAFGFKAQINWPLKSD